MKRDCVKRESVKQSHFVERKMFCVKVLSFLVTIE